MKQQQQQEQIDIFPQVIDSLRLVFEYQDGKFETNSSVRIVNTHNEQKMNARKQRRKSTKC